MVEGEDLSTGNPSGEKSSRSEISSPLCGKILERQTERPDLPKKDLGFVPDAVAELNELRILKFRNPDRQELTLNYLRDSSKPGNDVSERNSANSSEKESCKRKEPVSEKPGNGEERDFLTLNDDKEGYLKDEIHGAVKTEIKEKKAKLGALNLSLSLATTSNQVNEENHVFQTNPVHSQTICSNDHTAASLSYSYSHPFSHNPSCSLTGENCEFSTGTPMKETDIIWNCGEGTNGSVHSRFKPIADHGVLLSDHRKAGSDIQSFLPSELPARPSADSRGMRHRQRPTRPYMILHEIVSEPVNLAAQTMQTLPSESLQQTKNYLSSLLLDPKKNSEELTGLQSRLDRRSDLSVGSLSRAEKNQLEILVAIRTGLPSFLSGTGRHAVPTAELAEIFLLKRCRNVDCRSSLPVDDCDCRICSDNKGFCRECMCPVCLKFDCASNTCGWVGCDLCSHWCHASCAIQKNLIRPGPSLKGPSGMTEMQFRCSGCGHASEMFGFVKDVFLCCSNDWGLETLIKELDCVVRVFAGSEDFKGRELQAKAKEMIRNLSSGALSPPAACSSINQFFNDMDERREAVLGTEVLQPSRVSQPTCVGDGFDSLESVVRMKELEARMFQTRADDARRDAESCMRMVQAKKEKIEEEYTEKLARLCLQESEERRRRKLDELNALETSRCEYHNMKMRMQADIAGLLERMEATKQYWL